MIDYKQEMDKWLYEKKYECNDTAYVDLLSLAGMETRETLYSQIITQLLRINNELCNSFLFMLSESLNNKELNEEEWMDIGPDNINREYYIKDDAGDGFVDILIKSKSGKVIIIENKINAGDQPKQLERYSHFFSNKGIQFYVVYLTCYGYEPSADSLVPESKHNLINEKRFACISYEKQILSWLDSEISKQFYSAELKSSLIQFKITIRGMLNMDNDILTIVKEEFDKLNDDEIDKFKKVVSAMQLLYNSKRNILYFAKLKEKLEEMIKEGKISYWCNNEVFDNQNDWIRAVKDNAFKYYGIMYSIFPDFPGNGFLFETEGEAQQYTNRAYFGTYVSDLNQKGSNIVLRLGENSKKLEECKHWGDWWEWTSYVDNMNYTIAENIIEVIEDNYPDINK